MCKISFDTHVPHGGRGEGFFMDVYTPNNEAMTFSEWFWWDIAGTEKDLEVNNFDEFNNVREFMWDGIFIAACNDRIVFNPMERKEVCKI